MTSEQLKSDLVELLRLNLDDLNLLLAMQAVTVEEEISEWYESQVADRKLLIAELDALIHDVDAQYDEASFQELVDRVHRPDPEAEKLSINPLIKQSKFHARSALRKYNQLINDASQVTKLQFVVQNHVKKLQGYLQDLEAREKQIAS
ncbi:MAG: hypothetical protein HKN32_08345 [Flavobacteriales bacterium]|nr:hypothetical protein [Flavobacteriales bacterium]